MTTATENILEVNNLKMWFPVNSRGIIPKHIGNIKAVDDVTFSVKRGETLGVVGESGCGKTTVGRSIMQVYDVTGGEVVFEGQDLTQLKAKEMRSMRRRMQMIFQDPYSSLNPRMTAGNIIGEPIQIHGLAESKKDYADQVEELLRVVGLNPYMRARYPHEFSGGQRQRIGIARSLAVRPSLIIADEPVSALDVSIQAQVINLLQDLQEQFSLTYMFIAHDLSVVRHISDRIAVMYLGHIVELADRDELYENPMHPYTRALLSAVPIPDPVIERTRERIVLEGDLPSPTDPPPGCVFKTRCPSPSDDCLHGTDTMHLIEPKPGHFVDACCINCG